MAADALLGRRAVVTGAASGIGREIAVRFAAEGARVGLLDRDGAALEELARDPVLAAPATPVLAVCDVSRHDEVADAFERLESALGGLDTLVCAAGIRHVADSLTTTPEQWEQTIAVDLSGTFYCCQAAARAMVGSGTGGSIVNIASVTGMVGVPDRPAYVAAKHGVVGLTRAMASDLARYRVRVNAICPGVVRTPMTESYFEDASAVAALEQANPLGPYGLPRHVADAAVFLASAQSEYVTGIVLPVDGGFTAEKAFSVRR